MKRISMHSLTLGILMATMLSTANAGSAASGFPTHGSYRVDTESTRTAPIGPNEMTVVQRIDGATGQITVTRRSTLDPSNVSPQLVPGEKPVPRCVAADDARPPMPAGVSCPGLKYTAAASGAALQGSCSGMPFDDRTWEHTLRLTSSSGVGADSLRPADVQRPQ